MELVSIIIPAYNIKDYLVRCVDSVLSQTYQNIEIILVDDGSTDDTPRLCDIYSEKNTNIKVIHKSNGGLSDARNHGIDIAKGEYLMFVDSDDWIEPNMVEELYLYCKRSSLKLTVCECIYAYEDGNIDKRNLSGEEFILDKKKAFEMLLQDRRFRTNAWNKIYHKSLWENIRFPYGKKYEDVHIMHEIYDKCDNIGFIDSGFYYYFQRKGSIVHQPKLDSFDDLIEGTIIRYNYLYKYYHELVDRASASVITSVLIVLRNIGINKIKYTKEDIAKYCAIVANYRTSAASNFFSPRTKIDWLLYKISPYLLIKVSNVIEWIYHNYKVELT